jgi:hypothetical protein
MNLGLAGLVVLRLRPTSKREVILAGWRRNKRWAILLPTQRVPGLARILWRGNIKRTAELGALMHDPNPHKLTEAEWRELESLIVVRESWGLEEDQNPLDLASLAYGARFNFVSGSPGYIGDLYLLQGDALAEPLVLRRGENGRLMVC